MYCYHQNHSGVNIIKFCKYLYESVNIKSMNVCCVNEIRKCYEELNERHCGIVRRGKNIRLRKNFEVYSSM